MLLMCAQRAAARSSEPSSLPCAEPATKTAARLTARVAGIASVKLSSVEARRRQSQRIDLVS
ncbi:hypothetical protein HCDSEM_032 [Candidatus Hodgkinia cicadicola Dsem]|nr:hypothetical protein HCDSEM_032 [Candidatus Hodgkinia cicadicola Dsem]